MKYLKNRLRWLLIAFSHYATIFIGFKYAKYFPMYFVSGFPRSGTSWLSEILGDYYNLPRPRHYFLPLAFASIVHTHVKPYKRLSNVFYIYRDGRESYTSWYYKTIQGLKNNDPAINRDYYLKLFGEEFEKKSERVLFHLYLKDVLKKKNWSNHVKDWMIAANKNPTIAVLSYENLIDDPYNTLIKPLQKISGTISEDVLFQAVRKNSFDVQIKRPKEQHRTTLRSAKKETWRSLFTKETANIFDEHCGEMLYKLGYELDRNWINKLPVH